ncbi:MAG: radical SAM protein [Nanoarchaeota archaeon]|nr:radical SAM protein [Nanoarchaeota archaeon]MBU1632538.1 radical SAM protein [Nanoarchaeota archaeon]MBU1875690.1 radical SAM protein [Nanoarchaeota archaeon]
MISNQKYLDMSREKTKKMFRVQWHITEMCNLNCIHCYQDELCVKDELNLNQIKTAANMLKKTVDKWGMDCEISLTGGEPFVRKEWFEICKFLDEMGFYISILSNGLLIDEKIIQKLKEIKNLRYIQISLDGGSKEVHEKVRGRNTFDKTISSINLLKENEIKVATKFTVHKLNFPDLVNYLNLTEALGVDFVSAARYIPWGQGNNIKEYFLTKEEVKNVYELVLKYANKNQGKILYDTRRPLWVLLKDKDTDVGGRCMAGINGLTILPNGDVLPCRPMGVKIGNILKQTFFEMWYTSDLLWKIRNYKHWSCGECGLGKVCGGCLAISNAIHKDYFVNDPQCFKEIV